MNEILIHRPFIQVLRSKFVILLPLRFYCVNGATWYTNY